MRKVFSIFMLCVLVCASFAWADEGERQNLLTARPANYALNNTSRDGSCVVGLMVPDSIHYYWTWIPGEGFANFVDPATDQPLGVGCTAPIYPFQINSVEAFVGLYGTSAMVGQTMTVEVDIQCPANMGTTYANECNGPGPVLYSTQYQYTVTQYDYDSLAYVDLVIPFDNACVQGPFFYTIKLISWTGATTPTTEIPVLFSKGSAIPNQTCKVWYLTSRTVSWNGQNVRVAPCWLEVVTGFNPPVWGPWATWVNGTANAGCTPLACTSCDASRPGDVASNPLPITSSQWTQTIPLCDYCFNYDGRDFIGNFTASGSDMVLELVFPSSELACFYLTLTPACPEPTFFRIRSWMVDASDPTYPYLSYVGTPNFPAFNQAQVYDFTSGGPNGCYYGDGVNPIRLLLYLDTRGCCCPVTVTYAGDQPLPVELSSFDATGLDGKVSLTWQTRSETSVDHYVLTRNDNATYEVHGLGDNAAGHTYSFVDNSVVNGTRYTYTLSSVDINGAVTRFERTASATPMAEVVTDYALNQNYPNPFNPSTSISYAVKEAGLVTLKVYSVDGRLVSTLVNAKQEAGKYTVSFDGSSLASGVYLYTIETNGFSAARKMVLMK